MEEFRRRVALYESLTEPLARMAGVLGRWGDGSDKPLILDVIRMLCAHADREGAGLIVYIDIRTYSAVLVMTGYGLGLLRSDRWADLHELFAAQVKRRNSNETKRAVERLFLLAWPGGKNDYWKKLEGFDQRETPLSDHLCELFEGWSKSFVGVLPDFERLYESWEILGSLAHLERAEIAEIEAELAEAPRNGFVWFPIGRSGWHEQMRERILGEFLADGMKSTLLEAGFGKGNDDFLQKSVANYQRLAWRMGF